MSESKSPDPNKASSTDGTEQKPPSPSAQSASGGGKDAVPAASAPSGTAAPAAKGKGLIAFVGRLRRSSRKSRAAAVAAREAAAEAAATARREERLKRAASLASSPGKNKIQEPGRGRSGADDVVKPIRPEDLRDPVPGENKDSSPDADKKTDAPGSGEPGRLSIEKVERLGTRSQRGKPAIRPVVVRDEKEEKKRRNIAAGFKIALALVFFVVGGVLVFLSLRETRVKIAVNTSAGYEVEPEILVVGDFQERIDLLKRDLQRREEPLRKTSAAIDQDLSAAKADYAGRAAKRKLLVDAMTKDKEEIPAILESSQKSLEKLWREDADNLDAEYDQKKDAFNQEIAARAKKLNLAQYAPSEELDAPEIAVNAFRLALYSAPDGVDTGKEREWAEGRLKSWRKFEEDWSERQLKIKQEADALRQTVQPEIDEVKGRVLVRKEEIAAIEAEIDEFGKEVARHEEKKKDIQEQLGAVVQPFYQDLLKAPNDYVLTKWPVEKLGLVDIRNLDRDPNFPPGEYRILVRAKKKGADYWALKTFTVKKYKTSQVVLEDGDFVPVKSLLEDK